MPTTTNLLGNAFRRLLSLAAHGIERHQQPFARLCWPGLGSLLPDSSRSLRLKLLSDAHASTSVKS
jgi:hypothetical protein